MNFKSLSIAAIGAIAGQASIRNLDFTVFAVPVMLSAVGTTKTLTGAAKTANFDQKIAESMPGTTKTAKSRCAIELVAAIAALAAIGSIVGIGPEEN